MVNAQLLARILVHIFRDWKKASLQQWFPHPLQLYKPGVWKRWAFLSILCVALLAAAWYVTLASLLAACTLVLAAASGKEIAIIWIRGLYQWHADSTILHLMVENVVCRTYIAYCLSYGCGLLGFVYAHLDRAGMLD